MSDRVCRAAHEPRTVAAIETGGNRVVVGRHAMNCAVDDDPDGAIYFGRVCRPGIDFDVDQANAIVRRATIYSKFTQSMRISKLFSPYLCFRSRW